MNEFVAGILVGITIIRIVSKYLLPVLDIDRTGADIQEEAFLYGYEQGYDDGYRRIDARFDVFGERHV